MDSRERQWDCFIAYPAAQAAFADDLATRLSATTRVFIDRQAIRPGEHWPSALADALTAAPVTVVIAAPETERSYYEQEEIIRAIDAERSGLIRRVRKPPTKIGEESLSELELLSTEAHPTNRDVELVLRIVQAAPLSRHNRRHLDEHALPSPLVWRGTKLVRRSRGNTSPDTWAIQVCHYFESGAWARQLPKPKKVVLQPFYLPRSESVIPIYRVSDFKGLEAEVVLLLMRGQVPNQREVTYVGVSRARVLLYILGTRASMAALPRSFSWD